MTARFTLLRTTIAPALPRLRSSDVAPGDPQRHPTHRVPPVLKVARAVAKLPYSHAVRSACGLTSFLGLLSLDGVLLETNQSTSTPPELSVHDAIGRPFWDASWWIWSPSVQERLRGTVARVATGRVIRYHETALVRRNQLITVDLAWVPVVRSGRTTALVCSVVDLSAARVTGPADRARQE